ncbi:hypothetical protein MMC21_007419 [Puttea exsequens]|nr:hypothetical protein [Puttea exsequens]
MVGPSSVSAPLPLQEAAGPHSADCRVWPQARISSAQLPSSTERHSLVHSASNPWTNPRKRPHHADVGSLFEPVASDDHLREADNGKSSHAPKRNKGAEWPLKNSDEATASAAAAMEQHVELDDQNDEHLGASNVRPSKFQEGSMNDKVSQKPPSVYTKDEEAMENYARGQDADGDAIDMTYDASIEASKPTGVFKFGKAFASTFSPANIWQGINGMWKEKEKAKDIKAATEKNVLQERQIKAAEAYNELKKSGYKGMKQTISQINSHEACMVQNDDTKERLRNSFRDSAIDIGDDRLSSDCKDSDHLMGFNEALLVPAPSAQQGRSVSPFSNGSPTRKSSMHFRRPSFQNLKKVTSQMHLSSIKKTGEVPPPVPSIDVADALISPSGGSGLRRQPSKKDVAKQQRLSKKVSDLETKLTTARRELEMSVSIAPPVPEVPSRLTRASFIPSRLSSLPSERNMTPQQIAENGGPALKESSEARNRGCAANARFSKTTEPVYELEETAIKPSSKPKSSTRRRSSRQLLNHTRSPTDEDPMELDSAEVPVSKAKPTTRAHHTAPPLHPSETPQSSPTTTTTTNPLSIPNTMPPFPHFSPTQISPPTILAMRSSPTSTSQFPFGTLAEDLTNLHRAHPAATETELIAYLRALGRQPKTHAYTTKTTNYTAVAHGAAQGAPFLGPPASATPRRTRSGKARRKGVEPPPTTPNLGSARKGGRGRGEGRGNGGNGGGGGREGGDRDKPLPDIQREDWAWDEDVF